MTDVNEAALTPPSGIRVTDAVGTAYQCDGTLTYLGRRRDGVQVWRAFGPKGVRWREGGLPTVSIAVLPARTELKIPVTDEPALAGWFRFTQAEELQAVDPGAALLDE